MKKLLVLLLVAILALALVACGEETPTTTTATGSSSTPDTTSTPAASDSTPAAPDSPSEPTGEVEPESKPLFAEGENIMNGKYEYMAIDPFWSDGAWPCAFENHHPELGFRWCMVFKMLPTDEFVQEQLIGMDAETGFGEAFSDYTWTLVIDEEEHVIKNFCIPQRTGFIYVRMDLGEDFVPVEGEHEYEVVLKITDSATNELVFWAWFTDPSICGPYPFEKPADIVMVPDEKPSGVTALPEESLIGVSGPAGYNASETYVNLFDGSVRTKLCTEAVTDPIIFTIKDSVSTFTIKGFSIIGANDDQKFTERVITKFKLYGADSGELDATWDFLCEEDRTIEEFGEVVNYGERYYAFTKDSTYRYYKIVLDRPEGTYQFSEVLLYAEKGSVTTAG